MHQYLGPCAYNGSILIPLQCHTAAGAESAPTGTPTYRMYGATGALLTGTAATGNAAGSDVDSQTGWRPFTIDLSAINGISPGDMITVRCVAVVSSNIVDTFGFLAQ